MNLTGVPFLRDVDRPVERGPASDPKSPRASEVLADRATDPVAVVVGVPFGGGSLSKARCEQAPAAVRASLGRFSAYSSDSGVSLEIASVLDAGDVEVTGDVAETQERIAACITALRERHDLPLVAIGGDNSITVGAARGVAADGLVTFDAHHDVRDGISNGSPVRQLLEDGLAGRRIVQVGIHGFANSRVYSELAAAAGVSWVAAEAVRRSGIDVVVDQTLALLAGNGATRIFVDVDLDCLDRAFSPGTAASLPGGLWPADLERAAFVLGASPLVCGMDLTELDPSQDVGQTTVRTAAAVMLAFVAGIVSR
ncbi:MAG: agmatinase family protein [Actinomycetota bacterium]